MQKFLLIAVIGSLACHSPALASTHGRDRIMVSAGGDIGFYSPGGDDFETAEDGGGVKLHLGVGGGERLGIDVKMGLQYSRHGVEGSAYHVNKYSMYIEPRLAYGLWGRGLSPFVGIRLGRIWGEAVHGPTNFSLSSDGHEVGGVAGLNIPLAGPLRGEISTSVTHLSFDPVSFFGYSNPEDRVDGYTVGIEIGLCVLFSSRG